MKSYDLAKHEQIPVGSASWSRRRFGAAAAAAAVGGFAAPRVLGRGRARVVIIGGGAAGATATRALAASFPSLDIDLIEANREYVTPFFANRYLGGLAPLERFTHGYRQPAPNSLVRVLHGRAVNIDKAARTVTLADGAQVPFDRLIVAPGVATTPSDESGGLAGYDGNAEARMPHAYLDSTAAQWRNLAARLTEMPDGGVVAISVPKRPYRCHPAPYERASLIAARLTATKPRSKVLILDANTSFPLMDAYQDYWERHFGALVEWVPGDFGGTVTAVEATSATLITEDDRHTPTVANVIPPHRAGLLARTLGLVDASGWCPIDARTFESSRADGVHVIGDAIDAGDMPKSAFAANGQAKICAAAVGAALTGDAAPAPALRNACYFLLMEGAGLVVGGRYTVTDGRIKGIEGHASQSGEDASSRATTAAAAERWYKEMIADMFG